MHHHHRLVLITFFSTFISRGTPLLNPDYGNSLLDPIESSSSPTDANTPPNDLFPLDDKIASNDLGFSTFVDDDPAIIPGPFPEAYNLPGEYPGVCDDKILSCCGGVTFPGIPGGDGDLVVDCIRCMSGSAHGLPHAVIFLGFIISFDHFLLCLRKSLLRRNLTQHYSPF